MLVYYIFLFDILLNTICKKCYKVPSIKLCGFSPAISSEVASLSGHIVLANTSTPRAMSRCVSGVPLSDFSRVQYAGVMFIFCACVGRACACGVNMCGYIACSDLVSCDGSRC